MLSITFSFGCLVVSAFAAYAPSPIRRRPHRFSWFGFLEARSRIVVESGGVVKQQNRQKRQIERFRIRANLVHVIGDIMNSIRLQENLIYNKAWRNSLIRRKRKRKKNLLLFTQLITHDF